jgi:anti-sigma factor RsiW
MTPLECPRVEELLDLYVLGECDDAGRKAVDQHVAGCPRCGAELARSRELAGMLDVHFGEERALARLERRLRQQTRLPQRPRHRSETVRPLLSLAAMLLATLGLEFWLRPGPATIAPDTSLRVALAAAPRVEMAAPAAMRGQDIAKVQLAKKETLDIDLEGRSLAEWARAVRAGAEAGRPPLPPRVPLRIALRNPGAEPLHVEVGGKGFACRVHLTGPRVLRLRAGPGAPVPIHRRTLTIPPGGEVGITWDRLISVADGGMEYLYPLAPGEYMLEAQLRVMAWRDGQPPRPVWLPPSVPIALRLEPGR